MTSIDTPAAWIEARRRGLAGFVLEHRLDPDVLAVAVARAVGAPDGSCALCVAALDAVAPHYLRDGEPICPRCGGALDEARTAHEQVERQAQVREHSRRIARALAEFSRRGPRRRRRRRGA